MLWSKCGLSIARACLGLVSGRHGGVSASAWLSPKQQGSHRGNIVRLSRLCDNWSRLASNLRLCNPVPCSRTPSAFPAERPLGLKGDCGCASPRNRTSLVSKSSATFVKPVAAPLADGAFVRSDLAEPSATRHAAIGVFDAIAKLVRFVRRGAMLCLRHARQSTSCFARCLGGRNVVFFKAIEAVRILPPQRQPWKTPFPYVIIPGRAGTAEPGQSCSQLGRADDFWGWCGLCLSVGQSLSSRPSRSTPQQRLCLAEAEYSANVRWALRPPRGGGKARSS